MGREHTWRNFWTASLTARPHLRAMMMDEKLSSISTMADASLATSVPEIPIEKPTSAALSAGASLVPSPVTATVSPRRLSRVTRILLSSGEERARTCSLGRVASMSASLRVLKTGPSMTTPPSVRMPHSVAMARAVTALSPVTMRMTTPACWAFFTDSGTPGRTGSWMPTTPRKTRSLRTEANSTEPSSTFAPRGGHCW